MKAALAPFIVLGHVAQLSFSIVSIMAWGLAMVRAAVFLSPIQLGMGSFPCFFAINFYSLYDETTQQKNASSQWTEYGHQHTFG